MIQQNGTKEWCFQKNDTEQVWNYHSYVFANRRHLF